MNQTDHTPDPTPADDAHLSLDDERWEREITALLSELPEVDPPDGFIERAIDHRPLHAGRTLGVAVCVAAIVVAATVGLGVLDQPDVVPGVDDLAARHQASEASLFGFGGDTERPTFEILDDQDDADLVLPPELEPKGVSDEAGLEQGLWADDDEAVSVFVESGVVDFAALPAQGRRTIAGLPAWVDDSRRIVILQADGRAITIVGLDEGDVAVIAADIDRESTWFDAVTDRLDRLTSELGWPSVS